MTQHYWSGFMRSAMGAAVAIVVAAPALAQNTTAAVGGTVVGTDGKAVAAATVTITHTESKTVSTTTTDANGRYAARGLRVGGPYTITISKDGKTDQRDGIFLALAETLTFDAQLGAATSTVVVTGQGVSNTFNRANMGAGTNINSAQLNALASIQRSLQDYARTDPRISQTDKETGKISAAGQNNRFNSLTIDGVTTNDTFGLEGNNLPTLKQPISIDAIQSVQINLSNYDVTQKGYTGANINAVTKSGTNEFKGSVYYVYRDDSLTGDRFNRTDGSYAAPPKFKEDVKGFTLGGPVIPDKLFFFASYEELKSTRNAPDFGPVGDSKTNVAITTNAMTQAAAIAKSAYGIDVGNFTIPTGAQLTVKDSLIKLDWTINDNHRASLRYTKTEQSEPIFPNITATALSLNSNWYTQGKRIETTVAQWFADWTPAFSTEAKLSFRDYNSVPVNNVTQPQVALNFLNALPVGLPASTPNSRTLFFGTERSRHFNILRTKTTDGYFSGTYTTGDHEIKAGLDISKNEIYNAFLQDTYGNYNFRCVNSSSAYTYSFGAINCATATALQVEAAVLENFQKGRPFTYQVQAPINPTGSLNDGVSTFSLTGTGLFLQDTWNVSKALTLTGGVRLDTQSTSDRPLTNVAAAAPVVPGNAATNTRQTGGFGLDNTVTLDGAQLLQPRLGFNWNLGAEKSQRMQLRGGFGLFQGAAASVWLSNGYSNPGVATALKGCGGSFTACPSAGGVFTPDVNNQPKFAGNTPAANVDFIQKDLGQPAVWKANLAFDTELPWYGLSAGAEWLHTQTKQGIYYKHLNLGTVTKTGSDGRELYYNANGFNTDCWTAAGATTTGGTCAAVPLAKALSNSAYNNVLIASKTSQGGGDALTLSLGQSPWRGFNWQAAYTRTSAKEVSPLTSSVSNSNWAARSVFNPNEEVSANSATLIRDRINGAVTWSQAFVGSYKTTFGLFYEGRKGLPYSWTFNNDLNGDGQAGNDLMYIPKASGSGEVVFAGGAADEARFWQVVESNPELRKAKGGVVKRNGSFAPYVNQFDLRMSQELPGLMAKHKGVITLDFLNVGNMINKSWGRIDEVAFQSAGGLARSFVNYKGLDSSGKYIYSTMAATEDLSTRQAKGESQWAVQVTLRYEF